MRYTSSKLCISMMGLALFLLAQEAVGLTLQKPTNKSYRSDNDPILVTLGSSVPPKIWQYLHLEIDAIDVTDFIAISRGKLKYQPQEPFANGPHEVRLVAVLPDGNIEELANWKIETRASATFVESSIESAIDLQITHRIADNFPSDSIDIPTKTQGQGSYVFSSNQSTGDWRLKTSADFIYNSQRDQTQNDREFDVNEFNLTSEWSQAVVKLGHQTVPVNSLILTDFNRRGVSATYHNESNSFEVAGFRTRTEMFTGFQDGMGIGKEDKRTSGSYARITPVSSAPETLIVTGVYLDATGSPEGQADQDYNVILGEGDASAVIVESYLSKKRVYLRGEHAESSFDFDGSDTGYAAESDKASSVYVQYATERNEDRTEPHNWSLGFLHQKVGQWFYSLGNASLPADKETSQILTSFVSDEWQFNANVAREENNVAGDTDMPVIETRVIGAYVSYTPSSGTDKPQTGIFSNPSYSLSFSKSENNQLTTPSGYLGDKVDNKNGEIGLAVSFNGEGWSWGVSRTLSKEEDKSYLETIYENEMTSVEASITINENFTLSPVYQTSTSSNRDSVATTDDITTNSENTSVNLQYSNNDDISSSLSYSVSNEKTSDGSNDSKAELTELFATWIHQHPSENKYGLSYFARASSRNDETLETKTKSYQVFLGINITWPASF